MKVSEETIKKVITDVSGRLSDPKYISTEVDQLSLSQPNVIQYVVAHKQDLELEEIVSLLFQIAVIQMIIAAERGTAVDVVQYADLDAAATATPDLEVLSKEHEDLASYIFSNIDMDSKKASKIAGEILAHVAQAMVSL